MTLEKVFFFWWVWTEPISNRFLLLWGILGKRFVPTLKSDHRNRSSLVWTGHHQTTNPTVLTHESLILSVWLLSLSHNILYTALLNL